MPECEIFQQPNAHTHTHARTKGTCVGMSLTSFLLWTFGVEAEVEGGCFLTRHGLLGCQSCKNCNRWFIIACPTAAGGAAAGAGTWAGAGEVVVAGAAAGSGCCSTLVVAWFRQKLFKLFNYAANRKLCGNFVATVGPDGKDEEPTATATSTSAAAAAVENCCLARLTN